MSSYVTFVLILSAKGKKGGCLDLESRIRCFTKLTFFSINFIMIFQCYVQNKVKTSKKSKNILLLNILIPCSCHPPTWQEKHWGEFAWLCWIHVYFILIPVNRVGCLPYSHHGRATVTVDESGMVKYADWWGYEITMVELLADMYGFRWCTRQWFNSVNHVFCPALPMTPPRMGCGAPWRPVATCQASLVRPPIMRWTWAYLGLWLQGT